MPLILALFLATVFPSSNRTSWMRPESFHLLVGMPRAEALQVLDKGGWKTQKGASADEVFVDYSPTKSITLNFRKDRLHSIRFELYVSREDAGIAFKEEKAFLRQRLGEPRSVPTPSMLIYDNTLPNVMAVVSDDPKSLNGRQGLGMLVVRYYDPAAKP